MYNRKQGISPVIATILLLAITVVIAVGVWQFLQNYTEETFDNVSGDATIDLAFANKVVIYDSVNDTVVNIAKTTYAEDLTFDKFIFTSSTASTECAKNTSVTLTAGVSNEISFNSSECNLAKGKYDLLMVGNATVKVLAIDYE